MKLVHEAQRKVESEAFRAAELAEIDALAAIVEHRKSAGQKKRLREQAMEKIESEVGQARLSVPSAVPSGPSRKQHWATVLANADHAASAAAARAWRELALTMMTRGHDGYIAQPDRVTIKMTKLFYPKWWLQEVGYYGYFDYFKRASQQTTFEQSATNFTGKVPVSFVMSFALIVGVAFCMGFAAATRFSSKIRNTTAGYRGIDNASCSREKAAILYDRGSKVESESSVAMLELQTTRRKHTGHSANRPHASYTYGAVPTSAPIIQTLGL